MSVNPLYNMCLTSHLVNSTSEVMIDSAKRSDAYSVSKNIKNRIGRLNGEDLIRQLVDLLNHSEASSESRQTRYPIWHLLLLLKWGFMHGDFTNLRKHVPVSLYQVHALLDRMWDLSDYVIAVRDPADAHVPLRPLSHQQFWTMRRESIPFGLARQCLQFGNLNIDHPFQDAFLRITGVSIDDFLDLSGDMFLQTMKGVPVENRQAIFAHLLATYGQEVVVKYMNFLSKNIYDVAAWLRNREGDMPKQHRSVISEYFQLSPFSCFPLLELNGGYVVISPILLHYTLSTFVYDTLRANDKDSFTTEFGGFFETYLLDSLESTKTVFVGEEKLLAHIEGELNQMVVDAVAVENECNIYIEAKGVDMRWDGLVTQNPGTISKHTKRSIRKAVRQAYSLADRVQNGATVGDIELGNSENFLLVVTFKDFYLGNGDEYRKHIAKDAMNRLLADYGGTEIIPLKNIFFVSVDDLVLILGAVANGTWTLSELLRAAVTRGTTLGGYPVFRQLVLERDDTIRKTPLMQRAHDLMFQRLKARYLESS